MSESKAADEVVCRSCGEAIKRSSKLCPECGVHNDEYSSAGGGSAGGSHDLTQYETSMSDTRWYGVAAGTGIWLLLVIASATTSDLGAADGLLVLIGWVGPPLSVYFDTRYVRRTPSGTRTSRSGWS